MEMLSFEAAEVFVLHWPLIHLSCPTKIRSRNTSKKKQNLPLSNGVERAQIAIDDGQFVLSELATPGQVQSIVVLLQDGQC